MSHVWKTADLEGEKKEDTCGFPTVVERLSDDKYLPRYFELNFNFFSKKTGKILKNLGNKWVNEVLKFYQLVKNRPETWELPDFSIDNVKFVRKINS